MAEVMHLTHVERAGTKKWVPSCACGWQGQPRDTKRKAVTVAEQHWLISPLVEHARPPEGGPGV